MGRKLTTSDEEYIKELWSKYNRIIARMIDTHRDESSDEWDSKAAYYKMQYAFGGMESVANGLFNLIARKLEVKLTEEE